MQRFAALLVGAHPIRRPVEETTIPVCNNRSKTAAASIGSPRRSPQPAMPVWEVMIFEDFW